MQLLNYRRISGCREQRKRPESGGELHCGYRYSECTATGGGDTGLVVCQQLHQCKDCKSEKRELKEYIVRRHEQRTRAGHSHGHTNETQHSYQMGTVGRKIISTKASQANRLGRSQILAESSKTRTLSQTPGHMGIAASPSRNPDWTYTYSNSQVSHIVLQAIYAEDQVRSTSSRGYQGY